MYLNSNSYLAPFIRPLYEAVRQAEESTNFGILSMKTDIVEEENAYHLYVDLPGITKENIKLSYEDSYLRLEVKTPEVDKNAQFVRRERFNGEASRSYYMEGIDEKATTAHFENGVLEIVVPKLKEEAKAHYVEIN